MAEDLKPDAAPQGEPSTSDAKPAGESSTPAPDAKKADTPPGDPSKPEGEKRPTVLEHVMAALDRGKAKPAGTEGSAASPAAAEKDQAEPGAKPEAQLKPKPADEKVEDFEPVENPQRAVERRFNQVLEDNKRLRTELASTAPQAEHFANLQTWGRSQGISEQEFSTGLALMALSKRNPAEALKHFEPIVARLRQEAGIVEELPQDIADKLEAGQIDEETARELATRRLEVDNAKRRADARAAEDTAAGEARRVAEAQGKVKQSLSDWDREQVGKDPDFGKKRSLVLAHLQAIWARHGKPNTPEEAIGDAKAALEQANKDVRSLLPQPRTMTPTPDGQKSTTVNAAPKSAREAGMQAYRASRSH